MKKKYIVLLYYCYSNINKIKFFRNNHFLYCINNNIKGRIIISKEGINGTISGSIFNCKNYIKNLKFYFKSKNIEIKTDYHYKHVFQNLKIKLKLEIVNSWLDQFNQNKKIAPYINVFDFKNIKLNKNIILLDVRSKYEYNIGKFSDAITLNINYFREFYKKIKILLPFKNKKIITYCTGGVRCEKAGTFLLENNFNFVYQLKGGIIQYGIDTNGKNFKGKCYVFDERLSVNINKKKSFIIGRCYLCNFLCDRIINCANSCCNYHILICKYCSFEMEGTCSFKCKIYPNKRIYNRIGFYKKLINFINI